MSIEKKLLGTTPVSGAVDPEGVSFDGTNDYLSRGSDMTGNTNSKTFTFSCWVYHSSLDSSASKGLYEVSDMGDNNIRIFIDSSHNIQLSSGYLGGNGFATNNTAPVDVDTWTHIAVSMDKDNQSASRLYINDISYTMSFANFTTNPIPFQFLVRMQVARFGTTSPGYITGRLAHVFLDYTYRNLSTESNRRLFIDSDGKPSSTIPSSPILYLPMTDAATAGSNSGTGGDFTVNGVLDTAGRAPNQWNCSASTFDGSADRVIDTSVSYSDSKFVTMSFICKKTNNTATTNVLMIRDSGTGLMFSVQYENYLNSNLLSIRAYTTGGLGLMISVNDAFELGVNKSLQLSIDMSSQSNTKCFINGVSKTVTFSTFTDENLVFSDGVDCTVSGYSTTYDDQVIGELYFDTVYTDLSTDNPFWDADANRPKPVRQVISETGTTPLIALPLRGNDAGNNLGSGGDFTVNSGPFTGARGGSEFWARSANFDGTSSEYLSKSSLTGISNTKKCTLVVWSKRTSSGDNLYTLYHMGNASSSPYTVLSITHVDSRYEVAARNSANTGIFLSRLYKSDGIAPNFVVGDWYGFMLSFDLSDTSKRHFEPLNFTPTSTSWNTYTNDTIAYTSSGSTRIGTHYNQTESFKGDIGFFYFTTDYTDFSQESNRNLFVDQLGYPKDLTPAIEAGTIADPLIYMKFDDTSALGTNSGTGGNFTVNGTVTAGADVDPNA